jgi:hypothetical protein
MQVIEEELTPFGFINTGTEDQTFVDGDGQVWSSQDKEDSNFTFL